MICVFGVYFLNLFLLFQHLRLSFVVFTNKEISSSTSNAINMKPLYSRGVTNLRIGPLVTNINNQP